MWNKIAITALGGALLLAGQSALADPHGGRYEDYDGDRGRASEYDYARVLSAEPITRRIRVTQPRRECFEETRYAEPRDARGYDDRGGYGGHPQAAGGIIAGGLIGALIGSQFGHGDGRRAATAAGALIGSAIGHDAASRQAERDPGPAQDYAAERAYTVHHCDVRYDETWEERIEAYRVTYEYNGRRYSTQLPYDPGPQLRINVMVQPDGR